MKYLKFSIVAVVVVGFLVYLHQSDWYYLLDWNSGEMVGANLVILAEIAFGIYLIRLTWKNTIGITTRI